MLALLYTSNSQSLYGKSWTTSSTEAISSACLLCVKCSSILVIVCSHGTLHLGVVCFPWCHFHLGWDSYYWFCTIADGNIWGIIIQCCLLLSSEPQADELSSPFGQISLSRQGSTEAPDPSSAMFQPPIMSQHPQQTGFIMASPGQPITASNYSASGHTAPAQQVLQPQSYMQPPQQVSKSVIMWLLTNLDCCWENFKRSIEIHLH